MARAIYGSHNLPATHTFIRVNGIRHSCVIHMDVYKRKHF